MFTVWVITTMKVGKEMELFITLTKYNTCQRHVEGNTLLVLTILSAEITCTIICNVFLRNGTYLLLFTEKVYNNMAICINIPAFVCLSCTTEDLPNKDIYFFVKIKCCSFFLHQSYTTERDRLNIFHICWFMLNVQK